MFPPLFSCSEPPSMIRSSRTPASLALPRLCKASRASRHWFRVFPRKGTTQTCEIHSVSHTQRTAQYLPPSCAQNNPPEKLPTCMDSAVEIKEALHYTVDYTEDLRTDSRNAVTRVGPRPRHKSHPSKTLPVARYVVVFDSLILFCVESAPSAYLHTRNASADRLRKR